MRDVHCALNSALGDHTPGLRQFTYCRGRYWLVGVTKLQLKSVLAATIQRETRRVTADTPPHWGLSPLLIESWIEERRTASLPSGHPWKLVNSILEFHSLEGTC